MKWFIMVIAIWITCFNAEWVLAESLHEAARTLKDAYVDPNDIALIAFPPARITVESGQEISGLFVLCAWDTVWRTTHTVYANETRMRCFASDPAWHIARAAVSCVHEPSADARVVIARTIRHDSCTVRLSLLPSYLSAVAKGGRWVSPTVGSAYAKHTHVTYHDRTTLLDFSRQIATYDDLHWMYHFRFAVVDLARLSSDFDAFLDMSDEDVAALMASALDFARVAVQFTSANGLAFVHTAEAFVHGGITALRYVGEDFRRLVREKYMRHAFENDVVFLYIPLALCVVCVTMLFLTIVPRVFRLLVCGLKIVMTVAILVVAVAGCFVLIGLVGAAIFPYIFRNVM